jgi:formylglycine-generating enzyme required for sulfatase activity
MSPWCVMMGLVLVIVAAGLPQARASVYGDFDGDGDVDLDDYAEFPGCLNGPEGGLHPDREPFDFNGDDDIDLADFTAFQRVFGTSAPPSGHGDFDDDGDIDLDDYAEFPGSLTGPGRVLTPDCAAFDYNDDDDVDLAGFAAFQRVFGVSAPPTMMAYGDFDDDGDVDLEDFVAFPRCLTGPGGGLGPDCAVFDFNDDDDVDLADFAAFQRAFDAPVPPSMVLVPGGEFEMGRHVGNGGSDELPVHAVYVDSFRVDVCEVTNERYCDYLNWAYSRGLIEVSGSVVYQAGGTEPYCDTHSYNVDSRIHWNGATFAITTGKEDHPVVEVSWYGAVAYCNWRSEQHGRTRCYDLATWTCDFGANGYRLPTEAEWEYAARGAEHDPYHMYPWGDDVDGSNANYWESGDPDETGGDPRTTAVAYYDGGQTPPGLHMANGYGLYDVAGNVWEWCNDWYDSGYYSNSPYDNPHGPASGAFRVLRGGSWNDDGDDLRCAIRSAGAPGLRNGAAGFRVAAGT